MANPKFIPPSYKAKYDDESGKYIVALISGNVEDLILDVFTKGGDSAAFFDTVEEAEKAAAIMNALGNLLSPELFNTSLTDEERETLAKANLDY
ncbi:MAG: hypothetical protein IKT32_02155 [Clostridia bacterium]|nr:hypothetical protein [Clostridia bacterium]